MPQTTAKTRTQQTSAAQKGAETRKSYGEQVQEYAGRALLIPVGAALSATDRVSAQAEELRRSYRTPALARRTVERDLRRFERRGTTARNRFERQVKKARTRVERELRQRRTSVRRTVRTNRTRVERETRQLRNDLERQARDAQERVERALTGSRTTA